MKEYTYFVSYSHPNGMGNCDIVTDDKISSWIDIQEMKNLLEKKYNLNNLIIINFILLNEEDI